MIMLPSCRHHCRRSSTPSRSDVLTLPLVPLALCYFCCCSAFLFALVGCQLGAAPPGPLNRTHSSRIYNLTSGVFKAVETRVLDRTVHKLLGVPYAHRPDAFEKSEAILEHRTRSTARNAETLPPLCIQAAVFNHKHYGNFKLAQKFEMSYDCLSINVYVPTNITANTDNSSSSSSSTTSPLLSAMLFIHGGSNAAGSSTYLDASALAAVGNVVVALPNYRLDLMGFFNLPEAGVAGNFGLWDQLNALKWLHANCPQLGCDPASITLVGHSAGSGDIMLLSQSPLAKPYIKRLIMQSGSGLAHWAVNYDNHVVDVLKRQLKAEFDASPVPVASFFNKKGLDIVHQVNYDQSKYVSSLNDSIGNFISVSTCNLTRKYACISHNLRKYLHLSDADFASIFTKKTFKYVDHELRLRKAFWELCQRSNINDFQYVIGYLHKMLIHDGSMTERALAALVVTLDEEQALEDAQLTRLADEQAVANSSMERMWRSMVNLENDDNLFSQDEYYFFNQDPCLTHFYYFIQNAKTIQFICKFVADFQYQVAWQPSPEEAPVKLPYFLVSPTLRPFLRCFVRSYVRSEAELARRRDPGLTDFLLVYDYKSVVDEMRICARQASQRSYRVELKKFKLNLDEYYLNFTLLNKIYENKTKIAGNNSNGSSAAAASSPNLDLRKQVFIEIRNQVLDYQLTMRSVYEFAMLTENPNHLHKANVDGELITQMPHSYLMSEPQAATNEFDVMVGVTSHESFYFLDHAFNFTDMMRHAFIYAHLINTTSGLLDKLVNVVNRDGLRACLKRRLFAFYDIEMSRAEARSNFIERNVKSLELISDVDFYLPLITQLKQKMAATNATANNASSARNDSRFFVYKYSYHSSFNYMLSELKNFYKIFDKAYNYFNRSVVPHFSELDYVFGLPVLSKLNLLEFKDSHVHTYNYTDQEYELSMLMIGYWTNFAKHGDPNAGGAQDRPNWLPFDDRSRNILDIDSASPKLSDRTIKKWLDKHKFWYEDLPNGIYDECLASSSSSGPFSGAAFILATIGVVWTTLCLSDFRFLL